MKWADSFEPRLTFAETGESPRLLDKVRVERLVMRAEDFLVDPRYIATRHVGAIGLLYGIVRGAGGDEWWVLQDDGVKSVYRFDELSLMMRAEPEAHQ